jgi:acetolactate synthase-1/2/3 large subunit
MTVADVIVEKLVAAGTRAIFGVPGGGGNLDLIDAATRAGLPFVLTATETAGALAALAQAEITGRPGVCLTTLGPGAASVVNGVACAWLDRAPLLVFTDTQGDAAAAFAHQRLDHAALFRSITKWSTTLTAHDPGALIDEAIARALVPPAGPVHIDCPGEVAAAVLGGRGFSPGSLAGPEGPASVDQSWSESLSRARKPLLIVGLDARAALEATAIRGLCERRHVPALVTYKAKGVVPDDHAWFAGVFTHGAIERAVVDESDLLIGVGLDPVELLPRPWSGMPLIVSCSRSRHDDRHVPFASQWVGDIGAGVAAIEASLPASEWDEQNVRRQAESQRARVRIAAPGLTAQQVVETAARRLGAAAGCVTVDAGAHMFPATMLWPVAEPNGLLISNGLSTMGFALPAAIGAALADRSRPVVALTGDGGLLMCAGELLTVAREQVHVIVIVFADASLSLIEIKQARRRLPLAGVLLPPLDWCALATSLGVAASRATDEAELDRAAAHALERSGPTLIEARVDRSNYGETLRVIRG